MPTFAVFYVYDDRAERRLAIRADHRRFLNGLVADGVLLGSGAYADAGEPGSLLVLQASSADAALAALHDDPFRAAGLIVERSVREWGLARGPFADVVNRPEP